MAVVVEARIDGLCRGGRRRIKLCVLRPVSRRVDRKDKKDTAALVYSYNTHTVQLALSSDLFMLIFLVTDCHLPPTCREK